MAEVLRASPTPDSQPFYQSAGLRRSHPSSSSLLCLDSPALSPSPRSTTPNTPQAEHAEHAEHAERISDLPPSKTSTAYSSSLADWTSDKPSITGWSMDQKYSQDEEPDFPDYTGLQFAQMPPTPQSDADASQSSSDEQPSESVTTDTDTTRSDSPLPTPTVADDTAVKMEPKQHVDYLSHDWREEDIWSSWRHIVSQRRVYGQRSRLENASWRTWAKSKYQLRTVSPETLNWLKESDVTWLYGPLKPAQSHPVTSEGNQSEPNSQMSKSNSFCVKKPILKKRSMSEVMLQKSLSTSSLVKQAAAAVEAQQSRPARMAISSHLSETPSTDPTLDYFTSRSTSNTTTPSAACECKHDKHIRFDEKVEQCIAVECKEGDIDEESDSEDDHRLETTGSESESDSDEGLVMMKRKKRPGMKRKGSGNGRSNSQTGRKMVETLPATTLKFKNDTPEASKSQSHHTFGFRNWAVGGEADDEPAAVKNSNRLSPSPSQETLRPTRPSRNYLIPDDDDDVASEFDNGSSWTFGASNSKSSLGSASASSSEDDDTPSRWRRRDSVAVQKSRARNGTPAPPKRTNSEEEAEGRQQAELGGAPGGGDGDLGGPLRRTESGMMMPYDDEDEDDIMAAGLFGRVSETFNTARDIAHVIWNVGWRSPEQ